MLLCDFHIHTTYSDGVLPLPKVVDLFGQSGHDVIAITDHIVNRDSGLGKIAHRIRHSLNAESWKRYADEIAREAERAWSTYGMLVLPGAEMTRNTINRDTSVHVARPRPRRVPLGRRRPARHAAGDPARGAPSRSRATRTR